MYDTSYSSFPGARHNKILIIYAYTINKHTDVTTGQEVFDTAWGSKRLILKTPALPAGHVPKAVGKLYDSPGWFLFNFLLFWVLQR